MSSKKARLIRADNYNYLNYYNLYNNKYAIKNNKLGNYFSSNSKIQSYLNSNNRSLLYSSVYKQNSFLCTKKNFLFLSHAHPLYMKEFLAKNSNINYHNNYNFYNLNSKKFGFTLMSLLSQEYTKFNQLKNKFRIRIYKKQGWYFNTIYKHRIRHKYENEDENKLLYRKYTRYSLQYFSL